jgi:hypothetical protein
MKSQKSQQQSNNRLLLKYAGLGMQILVSLALAIFVGTKVDKWLAFKTPMLVWIFPLLVIIVMIYQVIKDTSKK